MRTCIPCNPHACVHACLQVTLVTPQGLLLEGAPAKVSTYTRKWLEAHKVQVRGGGVAIYPDCKLDRMSGWGGDCKVIQTRSGLRGVAANCSVRCSNPLEVCMCSFVTTCVTQHHEDVACYVTLLLLSLLSGCMCTLLSMCSMLLWHTRSPRW